MSDDRDGMSEHGGGTPQMHPHDQANISLFNVCSILAGNSMRLSHALRNDPGVSEETQRVADEIFATVGTMLDDLEKFAKIWKLE